MGHTVATTEQIFTINNYGNFISTAAGHDLPPPTLHGIVTTTVSENDSRYYPAQWFGYIDGELLTIAWTDNSGKPSELSMFTTV